MIPGFGHAARVLVAGHGDSPRELADHAVQACERLAARLSTLLGDTGVQMLLRRSIVIASAQLPWLAAAPPSETVLSALRAAMEQQERDAIIEAFVNVLAAFVGLLERLVGEGLVERLLEEVWPTVFTHAAKDIP